MNPTSMEVSRVKLPMCGVAITWGNLARGLSPTGSLQKNVQGSSGQVSVFQAPLQVRLVDQLPPAQVEQVGPLAHHGQLGSLNQPIGLRSARQVQGNKIRGGQQFLQGKPRRYRGVW